MIIAYKFTVAPVLFALAIWLTISPTAAFQSFIKLAHEMTDAGPLWARLARWLNQQLSIHVLNDAAIFAWLGGLSTVVEGFLLLRGGVWGEWVVTIGLACLLPLEFLALVHHPGAVKAVLLALNSAIVVYLVHRRLAPSTPAPAAD